MRVKIKQLRANTEWIGKEATIKGWIRTLRLQKNFAFIEVNDGSSLSSLQVVLDNNTENYPELVGKLSTGTSVSILGIVVESPGKNQTIELQGRKVDVLGRCDPEQYPLQKKRHSFEFLRQIAHLRPRTNTFGAITRVRNVLAYETHKFFQERHFYYLHSPIITLSDCEGAGKLFQVTTLGNEVPSHNKKDEIDYSLDFFGKEAFLTVSGQLNAEIYACALSDVYTFGPTFRAENSNTSRHLAEFWMIEPEMAFADINDDMDLAEAYLKHLFSAVLNQCPEEMDLFERFICKEVKSRLAEVVGAPFERITYTDAIELLDKSGKNFEFPIRWGCDLQSEHERFLCEEYFKKPVIVRDYPAEIKSFYMRENADGKTVAAMDVLVPHVGEIVGGSQREERFEKLENKIDAMGLDKKNYWWYLELRKYGSVPHSGFGAGFERLVQFATGMENIRDVSAFPRYPGHAIF